MNTIYSVCFNVAADFSRKWHLSFNHSKSNVLIVGKRTNKHKFWQLGENYISEVETYKYLGVHITRNLSDHHHTSETIKKGNRLIGYIKSIIDNQDDFIGYNYYGNILWKSLALPMINYACAVSSLSENDYKRLNKLQLQFYSESIQKYPSSSPFR